MPTPTGVAELDALRLDVERLGSLTVSLSDLLKRMGYRELTAMACTTLNQALYALSLECSPVLEAGMDPKTPLRITLTASSAAPLGSAPADLSEPAAGVGRSSAIS